jgi:5'-3' exonuclease
MGIPSYYKRLADRVKGLVSKSYEGKPTCLYFDFNCLIYHVARRPNSTLPPYPGLEGHQEWENLLLQDIVKYITKVWQSVGQPPEVFFAVDGVVPMAKIKQQRLRRFKSVWLTEEEKKLGERENKPSWDTNCITPGTAFMKRLTTTLQTMCGKHAHWSVSGAEQPGEGEHKIMKKLREKPASSEPILIYGLDADLILLTLLNAKSPAYLVREESAMGAVILNQFGEEDFSYFSLSVLKQVLPPDTDIVNYVASMSLLGNDFLPHSLTIKIKDDGHDKLLKAIQNHKLVKKEGDLFWICHDGVYGLLKEWELEEERRMLQCFKKKMQMRGHVQQSLDTRPIEWLVEGPLISKTPEGWKLHPSWKDVYTKQWINCEEPQDIRKMCRDYMYGLQWVLDYYTGQRPVDMTWCFSRLLPPLWCHLTHFLEMQEEQIRSHKESTPIQPHEQLAMVLPLESWHFIEDKSLRSLPSRLPQYWPSQFSFFSVGRIHMWECEAMLPILHVDRIRSAVIPTTDSKA